MKVLVIAHGHPDFSIGGAELAAFNLYRSLRDHPEVEQIDFLARTDQPSVACGRIVVRSPGEYLWRQDILDWFLLRTAYATGIYDALRAFLRLKRPDVVLVHHYAYIGLEMLRELRRELPDAFICLTLHEYVAICAHRGQIVKARSGRLCHKESPEECAACMPQHTAESFWLRKHFIQKHFEAADFFVSPSDFLRRRYLTWGIPADYIVVNGQPQSEDVAQVANATDLRTRFGFFGQITEFKGLEVLLPALHVIRPEARRALQVEIHAANLEQQDPKFREMIDKLRAPLIVEGVLRWVGAYEPHAAPRLMRKIGWVVVPSIWWENSPMVIQESFLCRRPVIAANIGGMAEKVQHGVDGLHFEARNPLDLADTPVAAAGTTGLWERLCANIRRPISREDCAKAYLSLASSRV